MEGAIRTSSWASACTHRHSSNNRWSILREDIGSALLRIFSDIASLAFKWNKPLAGRILPVKGKNAGDKTDFQDPYLFNTVLRPLP
jgi:hypothetical protein